MNEIYTKHNMNEYKTNIEYFSSQAKEKSKEKQPKPKLIPALPNSVSKSKNNLFIFQKTLVGSFEVRKTNRNKTKQTNIHTQTHLNKHKQTNTNKQTHTNTNKHKQTHTHTHID